MQPPEPIDPNFRIELPSFEGPLDLLLHLIQKHELDILDLPIAFVTERYLSYLSLMERLNLDVASEYLVMAAKLAHIKSKMLLPTPPQDQEDEEDVEEMDPRQDLIRRLLEYQKYKGAAEALESRGVAGRDVFPRGLPAPQAEGPAPLAEVSIFKLLDAFQKVLDRTKEDVAFEVDAERISIQERITQIVELLRGRQRCAFEELFDTQITRYDVVVTFLAILEMAKMRMMRIFQDDPHSPIHIEYRVSEADGEDLELEVTSDGAPPAEAEPAPDAAAEAEAGAASEAVASEGWEDDEDPDADGWFAAEPEDAEPADGSDGQEALEGLEVDWDELAEASSEDDESWAGPAWPGAGGDRVDGAGGNLAEEDRTEGPPPEVTEPSAGMQMVEPSPEEAEPSAGMQVVEPSPEEAEPSAGIQVEEPPPEVLAPAGPSSSIDHETVTREGSEPVPEPRRVTGAVVPFDPDEPFPPFGRSGLGTASEAASRPSEEGAPSEGWLDPGQTPSSPLDFQPEEGHTSPSSEEEPYEPQP